MQTFTPELLWHGGANENGKPDPVYSIDLHPSNVLVTSGIDASIPPKGSVRLWKLDMSQSSFERPEFIMELNDHPTVINAAKFSPCGKHLATASDRQIIIYSVASSNLWNSLSDGSRLIERLRLHPCLQEIYDIDWSPDCSYVVAGSIDSKAEILRVTPRDSTTSTLTKESISLGGHTSYVQGVAWDPMNQMVVTQSADRTCKIHQLKYKPGTTLKLANKGHTTLKMMGGSGVSSPTGVSEILSAEECASPTQINNSKPNIPSCNLFADSTVPSFFRRLSFSPDGLLLVVPTGLYRPANQGADSTKSTAACTPTATTAPPSFCTHIFARDQYQVPLASLTGLEEPSVAVEFNPVLFKLLPDSDNSCFLPGAYRMVFAVVTTTSVMVYDTQHFHPIARVAGCHLATINDASWSADGRLLVVCSSDGYVSFVVFESGALGEPVPLCEIPVAVQAVQPYRYDYHAPPLLADSSVKEIPSPVHGTSNNAPTTSDISSPLTLSEVPSKTTDNFIHNSEVNNSGNNSSAEKKKRRITPTLVDSIPLFETTLASSPQASPPLLVNCGSPSTSPTPAILIPTNSIKESMPGIIRDENKKLKKRITPQLLPPVMFSPNKPIPIALDC